MGIGAVRMSNATEDPVSEYEQGERPSEGYIVFSQSVLGALGEAGVDLNDILQQASKQTRSEEVSTARLVPDLAARPGTRALDPVTIVATTTLIVALTPAVVRIVEGVLRRRAVARERELAPVTDARGNPVLGRDGQPMMAWRERESSGAPAPGPGIRFHIRAFGIEIDFGG
jgi:hypothetical protein